jgi:uncharacterized SAM-binding protein YcdF (DUF218 family)
MASRPWAAAAATAGAFAAAGIAVPGVVLVRILRAEAQAGRVPVVPDGACVVVLGATTEPTGPSRELAARLQRALDLWHGGGVRVIVVSGGAVGDLDEVADMRAWLVAAGVPDAVIVDGRPGANTRQTLATVARLQDEHGWGPWIAVSTPYHARRLRDEARRRGLRLIVSGPADSPEMRNRSVHRARVLTEVAATVFYALPGTVTSRLPTAAGTWRHSLPRRLARRL